MKPWLSWAILGATVLGAIVGALLDDKAVMFAPLGALFLRLMTMMVVPLVACSIVTGAASLGKSSSAGKAAGVTIGYYLLTTLIAVTLGVVIALVFQPGAGLEIKDFDHARSFSAPAADPDDDAGFWGVLNSFVPANLVDSMAKSAILQILFFGMFFGLATGSLSEERRSAVITFFDACTDALIWMMMKIVYLAPLGVFALMADAVGSFGWHMLENLLYMVLLYIAGLAIHMIVVYGGMVKLFSNVKPRLFFAKMVKAQLFALSSASSMATLPVNMEVCEEDLGLRNATSSFVLPIGATINMDGNSMYYGLAAVFLAQISEMELTFGMVMLIILASTTGSIGQAGVPGPSLLLIGVLVAVGIPLTGVGILIGVDRIFDMLRTAVNITGDASCAAVVDKQANVAAAPPAPA